MIMKRPIKLLSGILAITLFLSFPVITLAQNEQLKTENIDPVKIANGKEMAKKILSGNWEFDLNTGKLVKPSERTDKTYKKTEITPNYSSGSSEKSHQWLATAAVSIMANNGLTSMTDVIYNYFGDFLTGSDWPDIYENNYIYLWHFYHYKDHTNYLGFTSPTAMTKFNDWMNNANNDFIKNTNNAYAVKELGIAMHYLADMTEPHHVTNKTSQLSQHSYYEDYLDTIKNNYRTYSSNRYGMYGTNYQGYAQAAADYAASYINYAEAVDINANPDYASWDYAASMTLPFAQQNMAAVIHAFFRTEGY